MGALRIQDRLPLPGGIGTNSYFDWLVAIIAPKDRLWNIDFLKRLDSIPFVVPPGECESIDLAWTHHVSWLRSLYLDNLQRDIGPEDLHGEPSFFEWLVCMAVRIEDNIMYDPFTYPEDRSWCWFWVMLNNAGLDNSNNIEQDVYCLMTRNFSPSGAGSICGYIQNCNLDLRTISWWDQMQIWCGQNFDWSINR